MDIEYALRVLEDRAGEANSSTADSPFGVDSTKVSAWEIAEAGSGDSRAEDELIPTAAVDLTLLLDFLCRRFTFMASDEHRYLYVVQVHHPLLRAFIDLCKTRGSRAVDRIQRTIKASESQHAAAWRDLFATVNALRFIATTLGVWEQSSEFLELSKKMARSETTRTQVLKIHLEYSKQRLTTAAKAASAAVLATEEAVAVRQALTGPGSMIGPTAAFSAAYSVGSKTMKSIFGGRNEDAAATSPTAAGERSGGVAGSPATDGVSSSSTGGSVLRAGSNAHADVSSPEDDAETLLFCHSMFERQIAELRATESELLKNATDVLSVRLFEREMESYRCRYECLHCIQWLTVTTDVFDCAFVLPCSARFGFQMALQAVATNCRQQIFRPSSRGASPLRGKCSTSAIVCCSPSVLRYSGSLWLHRWIS